MQVTEVRVHLETRPDPVNQFVLAFASVTLDSIFKVHDLRVLTDPQDRPYVTMPNRKIVDRCPQCSASNPLRAKYCNECGIRLADNRGRPNIRDGKIRFYTDVAHPTDSDLRSMLSSKVLAQYQVEKEIAFEAKSKAI